MLHFCVFSSLWFLSGSRDEMRCETWWEISQSENKKGREGDSKVCQTNEPHHFRFVFEELCYYSNDEKIWSFDHSILADQSFLDQLENLNDVWFTLTIDILIQLQKFKLVNWLHGWSKIKVLCYLPVPLFHDLQNMLARPHLSRCVFE